LTKLLPHKPLQFFAHPVYSPVDSVTCQTVMQQRLANLL